MLFAVFRVVTLDYADASERLREPARDLGIDLAALAEDGTNRAKSFIQRDRKEQQESEGDGSHQSADAKYHNQGDSRRRQAAHEIDQSRADQVANAFDIGHDPRDQH